MLKQNMAPIAAADDWSHISRGTAEYVSKELFLHNRYFNVEHCNQPCLLHHSWRNIAEFHLGPHVCVGQQFRW